MNQVPSVDAMTHTKMKPVIEEVLALFILITPANGEADLFNRET